MVKINENEVLLSRHELFVLIKAAGDYGIEKHKINTRSKKATDFILKYTNELYSLIEQHIWWSKEIPEEFTSRVMNNITPRGGETKPKEFYEDKQAIRKLLLATLQKTRAYHDLKELRDDPGCGTVAEFENGGMRRINTIADSGIAMINDILAHL